MRRIIMGEAVGEFVMSHMPHGVRWSDYKAIGVERDGLVVAGVLFESMTACDVNMHCAIADGRALNWPFVYTVFDYPFIQCNLQRVTGLVPQSNERALKFDIDHLGFKVEGLVREALPGGENLVILGMLKRECKFLRGRWKK